MKPPLLVLLLSVLVPGAEAAVNFPGLTRHFEPNLGLADPEVEFLSRGPGYELEITRREIRLRRGGHVARMRLEGAAAAAGVAGLGQRPSVSNYLTGSDPARWRIGVPHFERVKLSGVYPGVDLVFYGQRNSVEYDFELAPGVDPGSIRMRWEGAERPELDSAGNLLLATPAGPLRIERPLAWQQTGDERRAVKARFQVEPSGAVGFVLGEWDRRRALVIDPVLTYSGYLGGAGFDSATAVAVDAAGNAYLCGSVDHLGLAGFSSVQAASGGGASDAFAAKIDSSGASLVYLTYLGGSGMDHATSIAADAEGNTYVGGVTDSRDFPLRNPIQFLPKGQTDGFVVKLSPDGQVLLFSSYLGGSLADGVRGIAVGPGQTVFAAGVTSSPDFPATPGALRSAPAGGWDAWVARLNPLTRELHYSTLLGGADSDYATAIRVDGTGSALITGNTYSDDFPVSSDAAWRRNSSGSAAGFITKLNPSGSGFVFSTYFPGASDILGLDLDEAGRPYLSGVTVTGGIPVTAGAHRVAAMGTDAFLAKLNSAGSAPLFSTFLGGWRHDAAAAVRVNAAGYPFAAGYTNSLEFPLAGSPLQGAKPGPAPLFTGFLSVFNPAGTGLVYSTYLGGGASGGLRAAALDGAGNAYLAGFTDSQDFPAASSGWPSNEWKGGMLDSVAAKLSDFNLAPCPVSLAAAGGEVAAGGGVGSIPVQAQPGCNWHVMASMPFVSLDGGTQGGLLGSGTGVVTYRVAPNPGVSPRTASISAGGRMLHLIQPGAGELAPYDDVPLSHPFAHHIRIMRDRRITAGCAPSAYCPEEGATRAQMAVFIARALYGGDEFPYRAAPYFNDVPPSHILFKWVQKLRETGVIGECSPGNFCPDELVTRGQIAAFLIRGLLGSAFSYSPAPAYVDVPPTSQDFAYIQKMRDWGITSGCTQVQYCPGAPATRGEMAVFIVRAFFTPR